MKTKAELDGVLTTIPDPKKPRLLDSAGWKLDENGEYREGLL